MLKTAISINYHSGMVEVENDFCIPYEFSGDTVLMIVTLLAITNFKAMNKYFTSYSIYVKNSWF